MRPRGGAQTIPRPRVWSIADLPAWAGAAASDLDLASLRTRLAARGPGRPSLVQVEGARDSAVLAALYNDNGGPHVVLTRRSDRLTNHRGEVSFPGGRMEPGESAVEAALRESAEEIGLRADQIEVIGVLDDVGTVVSRSLIHPVVGLLPRRPDDVIPDPHEVERVLYVPLGELMLDGVYREERWGESPFERSVHFFELEDETVWGATALMLVNLLSIALGIDDAPNT